MMRSELEFLYQKLQKIIHLPEEEWNELLSIAKIIDVPKNEHFFKLGEVHTEVAFVCSGAFINYFTTLDGKEFIKDFYIEGDFLAPLVPYLRGQPLISSSKAVEKSSLITIEFDKMFGLIEKDLKWRTLWDTFLMDCCLKREKREYQLLTLSPLEYYEELKRDRPDVMKKVSQYHIASYLGISHVSLSRLLNKNPL